MIRAAPLLKFDKLQRDGGGRTSTAWISHFAKYLDQDVLPSLPGHFGAEYSAGNLPNFNAGAYQDTLYHLTHLTLISCRSRCFIPFDSRHDL